MATPNASPIPNTSDYFSINTYHESVAVIRSKLPPSLAYPSIGIVCGSGLGGIVDSLDAPRVDISYSEIPHFANSTVQGHAGKLVFGMLAGKSVVCMMGRKHMYEGLSLIRTIYPIRCMKLLGIHTLIVTNAAGALNPTFAIGDIMVISDHLSLMGLSGQNPLIGRNIEEFGPRFPPVSDAYNFELRVGLIQAATRLNLLPIIKEGVYTFVAGPSFETRAEARFIRDAGGDCVGMSTVPEVIVARHSGLRVLGLSLITNKVSVSKGRSAISEAARLTALSAVGQALLAGDPGVEMLQKMPSLEDELKTANHAEVLESGQQRAAVMQRLVQEWITSLPADDRSPDAVVPLSN